jgi:hypothetical protein
LVQREACQIRPIDSHDEVAWLQTCLLCRGAVDSGHDDDVTVSHLHLGTNALELALSDIVFLLQQLRAQEATVAGVCQGIDHAADSAVGQGSRLHGRAVHIGLVDGMRGLLDQLPIECTVAATGIAGYPTKQYLAIQKNAAQDAKAENQDDRACNAQSTPA